MVKNVSDEEVYSSAELNIGINTIAIPWRDRMLGKTTEIKN